MLHPFVKPVIGSWKFICSIVYQNTNGVMHSFMEIPAVKHVGLTAKYLRKTQQGIRLFDSRRLPATLFSPSTRTPPYLAAPSREKVQFSQSNWFLDTTTSCPRIRVAFHGNLQEPGQLDPRKW